MITLCVDCKYYKKGLCHHKWHIYGTKKYKYIHVKGDSFSCDSFNPTGENTFYPVEKTYGENGDETSNVFE